MPNKAEITILLREVADGVQAAPEKLLEAVYDDLRRLAASYMKNERTDHTLQATALVHEAYMRLVDWQGVTWESRAQFFSIAAEVMRKILVDHARRHRAQKRGSGHKLVLDDAISLAQTKPLDIIALEDALVTLEKMDPRQAKIVELRFFGGLSIAETAYVMKVSETTVRREWTFAKTWLQVELTGK